jgi:hypothetical protein
MRPVVNVRSSGGSRRRGADDASRAAPPGLHPQGSSQQVHSQAHLALVESPGREKNMRAYRCGYCSRFHLGHRPPWQIIRLIRDACDRQRDTCPVVGRAMNSEPSFQVVRRFSRGCMDRR